MSRFVKGWSITQYVSVDGGKLHSKQISWASLIDRQNIGMPALEVTTGLWYKKGF